MNERAPQLTVEATTGVDVALPIAGAGGRSYAFIIDWHLRVLLSLAWWLAASMIYHGGFTLFAEASQSTTKFVLVDLPPFVIYFLYHPILEVIMRGRTPGKRMAGIRIVTREGASPGVGALLIRNAFRLIDSLPAFYCLGLGFVMSTAQQVRIGDLAAGTLLVYDAADTSATAFPVQGSTVDPRIGDLAHELVNRWPELAPDARATIGRSLLARIDPSAQTLDEAAIFERLRALGATAT